MPTGKLYFTTFLDPKLADYAEAGEHAGLMSTYNSAYLESLLDECGWKPHRLYKTSAFQAFAFVCGPK